MLALDNFPNAKFGIKAVVTYYGQAEWNVLLTIELSCYTHGTQHICTPVEYYSGTVLASL